MDFYSEVVIVTGGAAIGGMNRSVELLNMDGSHICNLPALPNSWVDRERAGKADFFMDHTQTGLVTCGGGGFHNGRQKYCVTFNPDEGSWQETHILQKTREFHSSWASPQGVMLLLNLVRRTLQLKYWQIMETRNQASSLSTKRCKYSMMTDENWSWLKTWELGWLK